MERGLTGLCKKLWGGYWQVVLRTDNTRGFKVLSRRWGIESCLAWILLARQFKKDDEKNRRNSQSMVYLAMLTIILKRF
ncbi:hypothetical protein AHMF7605_27980 [Adhaeribacter arboris]|uniref:Transposase DDE domain-containing protein n=1 Tax=Adhaeribacter arboris TaxID=2072846 RepID=A0A2T2YNG6_9BACT|nr:hypothetical protein AHMF7605_27980 [Adhaeribacter arboris]